MELTVIVKKGERQYVSLCPELDVVSQGLTIEESLENMKEAVELYLEEMGVPEGIGESHMIVTTIGVTHGKASHPVR